MGAGPHELDELLHALRGGAGREEEQEQGGHREDGAASGDELDASNPRKHSNCRPHCIPSRIPDLHHRLSDPSAGLYLSELKAGAYISSQCTQRRASLSEMKPRAAESLPGARRISQTKTGISSW